MSKGTRVVPIRLADELAAQCEATIARRNRNGRKAPWTFSDFVRIALVEKIVKMARCRGLRARTADRLRLDQARDPIHHYELPRENTGS